jgi:hypothetical protein
VRSTITAKDIGVEARDRKAISRPVVTFTKFPATFFPSPIVRSSIYNVYTPRQFLLRFYLRSFYYF